MSIKAMKRIKALLQDTDKIDSHTISAVVAECDTVILDQQPATGEPERCKSCDNTGHVVDQIGEWRGICNCPEGDAIREKKTVTTEPVKVVPYNPTTEMMFSMKGLDPALSLNHCRELWSVAWKAAPNNHPAPSVPATPEPVVVQHRKPVIGWKGQTIGYTAWRDGKGLDGWPHRELYDHPAPGVPDGWKLVPIEPTEKMLLAYTGGAITNAGFRWCRHQWSAMLAASPAQEGE